MFYRKPEEIMEEWSRTHSLLFNLEKEYKENRERLLYRKRLLDAELLLSGEYYNVQQ